MVETVEIVEKPAAVQSLVRAFAILNDIAVHPAGISLADLSRHVGLHPSTTFHLVKTLVALGYVRQSRETKRYHISRMVYSLAANALTEVELVNIARPILEDLAAETGETSHIAQRSGYSIFVAARVQGPGAFRLSEWAGSTRPAHCTAIGKVLLASLTPDRLERFLRATKLEKLTPKTITDPELLRKDIEEVTAKGRAFDDGEFDPELRCVAVPVRDFSGEIVAAIGISGPVWRLSLQKLNEVTGSVTTAATRLSAELGHMTDLADRAD